MFGDGAVLFQGQHVGTFICCPQPHLADTTKCHVQMWDK